MPSWLWFQTFRASTQNAVALMRVLNWCLRVQFDAFSRLRRMCRVLHVPRHVETSAMDVLEEAVGGRWGKGDWMEAVSAACMYVAIRRARLPLSMLEVADVVGMQPHHTWLIYRRVLSVLEDKTVPPVEPATFILRAVAGVPALNTWQGEEGQRRLAADSGVFLSFASTQGLLTGRHPLGVTAACILTAARAHQIAASLESVCGAVHAVPSTAFSRFKELWRCLVSFAGSLPWGAAVDERSLSRHLPFLLTVLRESQGGSGGVTSRGEKQAVRNAGPSQEISIGDPGPAPPAFQAASSKEAQRKRSQAEARQRLKESRKRWKGEAAEVHVT